MFKIIRKNAKKQIAVLVQQANAIECTVRRPNYLTDGFDYASTFVQEKDLREWMEQNYDDLIIRLWTNPDGTKKECTFTLNDWSHLTFRLLF